MSGSSFGLRNSGADLGGGCRGCAPPHLPEMTCGFLIQLVFCQKKSYVVYWCWSRARDECTPSWIRLCNCCDTTSLRKQPTFGVATTGFHAKTRQITSPGLAAYWPAWVACAWRGGGPYVCMYVYVMSRRSFENVIAKWTFCVQQCFRPKTISKRSSYYKN